MPSSAGSARGTLDRSVKSIKHRLVLGGRGVPLPAPPGGKVS